MPGFHPWRQSRLQSKQPSLKHCSRASSFLSFWESPRCWDISSNSVLGRRFKRCIHYQINPTRHSQSKEPWMGKPVGPGHPDLQKQSFVEKPSQTQVDTRMNVIILRLISFTKVFHVSQGTFLRGRIQKYIRSDTDRENCTHFFFLQRL